VAIKDTDGNATLTMASGSTLTGAVLLGNGNDTMIVSGSANISGATLLDGGNSQDSTVTDILGTAGAATNKFSFLSTVQSLAGAILKNWESVTLNNAAVTLTDGTLVTGTGTNSDASLQGLVLTNTSTLSSPATLAITGDVAIDSTSTLSQAVGGSITGNVTNAGLIYWGNLGHTLTINGNYTGVAGSTLSLETYLAGDNSTTDSLAVTGNTSGTSSVVVRVASGSPGAQTNVGIDVIRIGGTSAGTFTLANSVQAGSYEYVLVKGGAGGTSSDWYLTSTYVGASDSATTTSTGSSSATSFSIYRPGVSVYLTTVAANNEAGFAELGSFADSNGLDRSANEYVDAEGHKTWLRFTNSNINDYGANRFSTNATT
jgi:autotransporter family porin